METKTLIIIIICVLLVMVSVGVFMFMKTTSSPQPTATATGQPRLQPILSARVTALKTGGDSKVSGYSFRGLREYDAGNCSFQPSMNKYVSMVVDLTLGADPGLSSVTQVKAVWWTGGTPGTPGTPGTEWSTGTVNGPLTGPQTLSLTIPPNITNTITNIACAGNQDAFNRIFIWYNSSFDPTYKLWATIEIPTLGTAITTAFDSIATGTGTPLTVTLTAATATDVTVGSTQDILYRFSSKASLGATVATGINLKKKTDADTDTYEMKYGDTTVNVKSNKYSDIELPGYSEYVSFQVLDGVYANQYISFETAHTLSYKETPDDSCFFKIEISNNFYIRGESYQNMAYNGQYKLFAVYLDSPLLIANDYTVEGKYLNYFGLDVYIHTNDYQNPDFMHEKDNIIFMVNLSAIASHFNSSGERIEVAAWAGDEGLEIYKAELFSSTAQITKTNCCVLAYFTVYFINAVRSYDLKSNFDSRVPTRFNNFPSNCLKIKDISGPSDLATITQAFNNRETILPPSPSLARLPTISYTLFIDGQLYTASAHTGQYKLFAVYLDSPIFLANDYSLEEKYITYFDLFIKTHVWDGGFRRQNDNMIFMVNLSAIASHFNSSGESIEVGTGDGALEIYKAELFSSTAQINKTNCCVLAYFTVYFTGTGDYNLTPNFDSIVPTRLNNFPSNCLRIKDISGPSDLATITQAFNNRETILPPSPSLARLPSRAP